MRVPGLFLTTFALKGGLNYGSRFGTLAIKNSNSARVILHDSSARIAGDLWGRLARVVNLEYQRHRNHTTVPVSSEQPEPERFICMAISGSSTNDFAGSIELTISLECRHFRLRFFYSDQAAVHSDCPRLSSCEYPPRRFSPSVCGRYRRTTKEEELARIYRIPIPPQLDLPISYNVAPSQNVLAIRFNPNTDQRSLDTLRWGLVPYWAKDEKIGYRTINARAETVDTAPSYREAFRKRRCLIPADGFYEWKKLPGGKIPYAIGMKDDSPFVFAGLWEGWKDPVTNGWIRTCTIITGDPNDLLAQVHTRMPVILPEEYHARWLGEVENGDLKELLKPFPAEDMKVWPISSRVNDPKNDDEAILTAIEPLKFGTRGSDAELPLA